MPEYPPREIRGQPLDRVLQDITNEIYELRDMVEREREYKPSKFKGQKASSDFDTTDLPHHGDYGVRVDDIELQMNIDGTVRVFGSGSSSQVYDHGNLSGLGGDDHTHYLLADGTRAMSGSLDMGGEAITNVGNVDGVDVGSHDHGSAGGVAVEHADLTNISESQHHAAYVGLKDNANDSINPAADNRIQITDDGVINADAGTNTLDLTIDQSQISHDSIGDVSANDHHAGFVGLADNADASINPAADDRIQITDDGVINADAGTNTLDLTIDQSQIDHGSVSGLGHDDHTQYGHLSQSETVNNLWTFDAGLDVNGTLEFQGPESITTTSGDLTLNPSADVNVSAHLLPSSTDTYDLGSSTHLWRAGWLSELNSILFVENTVQVTGGWQMIPHQSGTLAEDVDSSETEIDFGTALDVNDFILLRGNLQVEYMQVVSQESPTVFSVTRDVDGSGANSWPQGHVFVVLGYSGDGRIEFDAQNATGSPRMSIYEQGSSYNAITERVRLGNLNGWGPYSSEIYGAALGDYAGDYLRWDPSNGLELTGKVTAASGEIGGWTLGTNSLYATNAVLDNAIPMYQLTGANGQMRFHNRGLEVEDGSSANIFAAAVTSTQYGGISVDAGDVVMGRNVSGNLALFWDASEGTLEILGGGKTGATFKVYPDYATIPNGGFHVGGTSDPGDNNLEVDGYTKQNDMTAPSTPSGGALFYANSGEMHVIDDSGNDTTISPHDPDTGEWIFYSRNTQTGREVRVDMERMVRAVEELTGKRFMDIMEAA